MNFTSNLIINIYSIMLLIVICNHSLKNNERDSLQHKLYMLILQVTILLLIVDIFSRFDGKLGTIYPVINRLGNFLVFLLNPILPSLWLLYVHVQVFQQEGKIRRLVYPLVAVNAVNVVMVVLTQFFGWFYYIDSDNIYHRGPFFLFSALITVVLIVVAFVLVIVNRKRIEKRHYFSLMFFAVPPFICVILQIFFYGISLMLNSVVLSLLMVSLNIQNHNMYIDYLTGVNNRKRLETYLKEKINTSTENKTFSAILIDMNNFKSINDTFGHDVGDDALETSVKLLKSCLRANDFIARFGGDEFYIVLDVSNRDDLEATVSRINHCIEKFNESNLKPYKLSFSMGYAVYDCHSHMNVEEFQKKIDMLMYENKRVNKEGLK